MGDSHNACEGPDTLTRTLKLFTIELVAEEWLVRSLLLPSESLPTLEEIKFYYHYLLGLQEYEVRIHERVVPETFQLALIGSLAMEEPTGWPHMDKTFTDPTDRERYFALIDRIVEIEYMRLDCGVVKEGSAISLADRILVESKVKQAEATATKAKAKREDWLRSVLESLNADVEHDDAAAIQESDTIAWVLAPLHRDTRNEIGYRILTNMVYGNQWATRIGTALFPDITVCRRIAIVNWHAPTLASRAIAQQILSWYIQTQTNQWDESISPWIVNAVYEVDRLLQPFRKIEFGRYMTAAETEQFSVPLLLQKIEDTHLFTATSVVEVYLPSETEWMTYLYHILKVATQGFLTFEKCEDFVRSRAQEWIRNQRGLYLEGPAFFPAWSAMWETILHNRPTVPRATRFQLVLNTLEILDPMRGFLMQVKTIKAIVKDWTELFVQKEIVSDSELRIVSAPLYDAFTIWAQHYLPQEIVKKYVKPLTLARLMSATGYFHEKKICFRGCTYRNMEVVEGWLKHKYPQLVRKRNEAFIQKLQNTFLTIHSQSQTVPIQEPQPQPQPQPSEPMQPTGPVLHIEEDSIHLGTL